MLTYPMTPWTSSVRRRHDVTEYVAVLENERGSWDAYVPDLLGCVAVGRSRDEVERLIAEAIPLHIESMIQTN